MGDIVPRNQLVKQGVQGIAGGIVGIAGLVIASSKEDRTRKIGPRA
jgi:hypothetical protein